MAQTTPQPGDRVLIDTIGYPHTPGVVLGQCEVIPSMWWIDPDNRFLKKSVFLRDEFTITETKGSSDHG